MTAPPIFTDGEALTAEKLQALGSEPVVYTPTLTAPTTPPTLGTGATREGIWVQAGPMVHLWFSFQFGSAGAAAGSGQYRMSLPVPVDPGALIGVSLGAGRAVDASVATDTGSSLVVVEMLSTDPSVAVFAVEEGVTVTATVPWMWAAGDRLFGHAAYLGAF